MYGGKMEEKKQIDKIIEVTAMIDNEHRVWGKDTDLGSIEDIRKEVKKLIEPFVISHLLIEKDIADKFRNAYDKIEELTKKIKLIKFEEQENIHKINVKKDKETEELLENFHIMSREYNKLLRDWYKLKYGEDSRNAAYKKLH